MSGLGALLTVLAVLSVIAWWCLERDPFRWWSGEKVDLGALCRTASRLNIVGSIGCGKSALMRQMCATFPRLTPVDTDDLFAKAAEAFPSQPRAEGFRTLLAQVWCDSSVEAVVVDGNAFRTAPDILWGSDPSHTTVLWLNYPLPLVLLRHSVRTIVRIVRGERGLKELCAVWSMVKAHPTYGGKWLPALSRQYPSVRVVRVRHPRQLQSCSSRF